MVEGWIKLHRQITENELWLSEPFSRAQAWVDLLLIANHSDGVIRRRGIKITVKRGQVGMSQDSLAERWRWSKNKVRRFLKELIDISQIYMKTELKNIAVSTLITITNYELYQSNGTENGTEEKPKTKLKTAPEQECKERKEGKEKDLIPYGEILSCLNETTDSKYRLCESLRKVIHARWGEGFRYEDFIHVIKVKSYHWKNDPKMSKYLRPETLFGTKFNSYRQEKISLVDTSDFFKSFEEDK